MSVETHEKYGIFNCPNCGAAAGPESVSCTYCGSSLATRVCASCFGAVSIGMHHCPWCGAGTKTGQPASPAKVKCPRCAVDLCEVTVGGHRLRECKGCGGLWVNKDAFQDICTREEEQEAVLGFDAQPELGNATSGNASKRVYVPCPECRKLMNRQQFAGCSRVIVDLCREHGVWFDRQELHQIVRFIREGGLKKSREREKRKLEDEKARLRRQQVSPLSGLTPANEGAFIASSWKEDTDSLLRVLSSMMHSLEK